MAEEKGVKIAQALVDPELWWRSGPTPRPRIRHDSWTKTLPTFRWPLHPRWFPNVKLSLLSAQRFHQCGVQEVRMSEPGDPAVSALRKRPRTAVDKSRPGYPRKRAVQACCTCRKRRTKCDNEKPACGSCVGLGIECFYDEQDKSTWAKWYASKEKEFAENVSDLTRLAWPFCVAWTILKSWCEGKHHSNKCNINPHNCLMRHRQWRYQQSWKTWVLHHWKKTIALLATTLTSRLCSHGQCSRIRIWISDQNWKLCFDVKTTHWLHPYLRTLNMKVLGNYSMSFSSMCTFTIQSWKSQKWSNTWEMRNWTGSDGRPNHVFL